MAKRPNGRWRARYRDEADREHARHFDRKIDAQQWLDRVTAAVVTDSYVDPQAAGSPSGPTSHSGPHGRSGYPAVSWR